MAGDRVAPAALDQPAADLPFPAPALGIESHVVGIFAAPEALPPGDALAVLGLDGGAEGERVVRLLTHVGEGASRPTAILELWSGTRLLSLATVGGARTDKLCALPRLSSA